MAGPRHDESIQPGRKMDSHIKLATSRASAYLLARLHRSRDLVFIMVDYGAGGIRTPPEGGKLRPRRAAVHRLCLRVWWGVSCGCYLSARICLICFKGIASSSSLVLVTSGSATFTCGRTRNTPQHPRRLPTPIERADAFSRMHSVLRSFASNSIPLSLPHKPVSKETR